MAWVRGGGTERRGEEEPRPHRRWRRSGTGSALSWFAPLRAPKQLYSAGGPSSIATQRLRSSARLCAGRLAASWAGDPRACRRERRHESCASHQNGDRVNRVLGHDCVWPVWHGTISHRTSVRRSHSYVCFIRTICCLSTSSAQVICSSQDPFEKQLASVPRLRFDESQLYRMMVHCVSRHYNVSYHDGGLSHHEVSSRSQCSSIVNLVAFRYGCMPVTQKRVCARPARWSSWTRGSRLTKPSTLRSAWSAMITGSCRGWSRCTQYEPYRRTGRAEVTHRLICGTATGGLRSMLATGSLQSSSG